MIAPDARWKILRFGIVGGTVALVFMGLTGLFAPWMGARWAFLAAYPLALLLHFGLNKWWTFSDRGATSRRQVGEYLAMVGVTFLIQAAVFELLVDFTPAPSWFAAGAANIAQMAITFVVMNGRIFAAPVVATEVTAEASGAWHRRRGWILAGLLAASLALRGWLACTGGQGYWPDEGRYLASQEAAYRFEHREFREGWSALIARADHLFFKVVGVPVALWERKHGAHPAVVAFYFSTFSVAALALIYGIARAKGASARESLLATFFAAGASSLFYYSRHFFPYDLSLFFCLLALWLVVSGDSWWRSFFAGIAAGLGFLSYNGYWVLGGVILSWHVLSTPKIGRVLARAALGGVGLLAPIVGVVLAARGLGHDLIASFREFSATITQGDFGRGYIFVWQYLWDAEGALLVVWLALAGSALWLARGEARRRAWLWIAAAALCYVCLVVCADVRRVFVVYGRIARILVPFLCLAAAVGTEKLFSLSRTARIAGAGLLVAGVAATSLHFSAALRQTFPQEFVQQSAALASQMMRERPTLLRMLNAERMSEGRPMVEKRPYLTLLYRKHPYEFRPYLYEGFSEELRNRFRQTDISMRLVEIPKIVSGGGDVISSGRWRMRVRFPRDRAGTSEPLMTGGKSGLANFLYVQYVDARRVRFGFDVWGAVGVLSPPVELDLAAEHSLILVSGKSHAPNEPDTFVQEQADVLVVLDDKVILSSRGLADVVDPSRVFVGLNFAGGSSARTAFNGEILSLEKISEEEVQPFLAKRSLNGIRHDAAWAEHPGPLRIQVKPAIDSSITRAPVLSSGVPDARDVLFATRESDGQMRLGFVHSPNIEIFSAPLDPAVLEDLVVSMGSFMPPASPQADLLYPRWLKNRLIVLSGERILLQWTGSFHPAGPETIALGGHAMGSDGQSLGKQGFRLKAEPFEIESLPASAAVLRVNSSSSRDDQDWIGYPGPVRLRIRFPMRPPGTNEPLVVTGQTGHGDFIFLRYLEGGKVIVGHDHWGVGATLSDPVTAAPDVDHELVVSFAPLFPSDRNAPCYQQEPRWWNLREECVVMLDGKRLLGGKAETHPSASVEIHAGMNPIGGSTTVRFFSGEILGIERAPLSALVSPSK